MRLDRIRVLIIIISVLQIAATVRFTWVETATGYKVYYHDIAQPWPTEGVVLATAPDPTPSVLAAPVAIETPGTYEIAVTAFNLNGESEFSNVKSFTIAGNQSLTNTPVYTPTASATASPSSTPMDVATSTVTNTVVPSGTPSNTSTHTEIYTPTGTPASITNTSTPLPTRTKRHTPRKPRR